MRLLINQRKREHLLGLLGQLQQVHRTERDEVGLFLDRDDLLRVIGDTIDDLEWVLEQPKSQELAS